MHSVKKEKSTLQYMTTETSLASEYNLGICFDSTAEVCMGI